MIAECPFCEIIERKSSAEIVYETPDTLAFFPLKPATRGHTMVVTKQHIENFLYLSEQDFSDLGRAVVNVGNALKDVLRPEGMNFISSAGKVATQTIMHFHIHLVPRWANDQMGEIWPVVAPPPDPDLEEIADAVRQACGLESLEDHKSQNN